VVMKYLQEKDLAEIFNINNFLKNLDFIFNRVFGNDK
jgi:adenylosuccinate lyase